MVLSHGIRLLVVISDFPSMAHPSFFDNPPPVSISFYTCHQTWQYMYLVYKTLTNLAPSIFCPMLTSIPLEYETIRNPFLYSSCSTLLTSHHAWSWSWNLNSPQCFSFSHHLPFSPLRSCLRFFFLSLVSWGCLDVCPWKKAFKSHSPEIAVISISM